MRTFIFSLLLLLILSPACAGVRYYVKVKPARPAVVVSVGQRPGPDHVWVDGHWVWKPGPGRYEWVDGCWKIPPGRYRTWVPGHWKNSPYGWYWVDGHWKR